MSEQGSTKAAASTIEEQPESHSVPEVVNKRVAELRKLIARYNTENDADASERITIVMDAFITEVCCWRNHSSKKRQPDCGVMK